MKIIYLHQYFKFPNEAGATRSFDLARGFNYFGHNVEIVTSTSQINNESERRWNKVKKNGLTVHYIFLPYENEMNYYQRSIVFFK